MRWFAPQGGEETAAAESPRAESFETLAVDLQSSEASVAIRAAKRLGELGDARAIEPLIAALFQRGGGSYVVVTILEALQKFIQPGDDRIVERLLGSETAGSQKPPELWGTQVVALGAFGDARAIEPLIAAARLNSGRDAEVSFDNVPSYMSTGSAAVGALGRILQRDAGNASEAALRAALELDGIEAQAHPHSEHDSYREIMEKVDCSDVHRLARAELLRRNLQA